MKRVKISFIALKQGYLFKFVLLDMFLLQIQVGYCYSSVGFLYQFKNIYPIDQDVIKFDRLNYIYLFQCCHTIIYSKIKRCHLYSSISDNTKQNTHFAWEENDASGRECSCCSVLKQFYYMAIILAPQHQQTTACTYLVVQKPMQFRTIYDNRYTMHGWNLLQLLLHGLQDTKSCKNHKKVIDRHTVKTNVMYIVNISMVKPYLKSLFAINE